MQSSSVLIRQANFLGFFNESKRDSNSRYAARVRFCIGVACRSVCACFCVRMACTCFCGNFLIMPARPGWHGFYPIIEKFTCTKPVRHLAGAADLRPRACAVHTNASVVPHYTLRARLLRSGVHMHGVAGQAGCCIATVYIEPPM